MAVLTIEELLARKEQQAQKGKPACKSVFIPGLGGEVEVVPMDPASFWSIRFSWAIATAMARPCWMPVRYDLRLFALSSMTGSCKMLTGAKNPTR